VSPDGLRLAVTGVDEPQLLVADLDTGEVTDVDVGVWDGTSATGPLWSPDSQWVFLSHDPDGRLPGYVDGGLLGYRVGEPSVRIVNIPGVSTALMQTIPRADQAPATRPCGVPLESEPIVGPCLVDVEPVDGPPPPPADDPLDPTTINVVVANGSGISGAAGEVSDRLAALGYPTPIPTDTTAPAEETPLDTVYYATHPDTSPQARQVAADLGLPDTAVQPYPGVGDASADLGLAQVLVVLGSSPGMLATGDPVPTTTNPASTTTTAGPTFLVVPESDLRDGQTVSVHGEGYRDGQGVMAVQCTYDHQACDQTTTVAWSTPGGAFDEQFTVRRFLSTPDGRADCREVQCALFVGGVGTNTEPLSYFLDLA
jgi:hypothetical protein